jgi:selenide,water dikinase
MWPAEEILWTTEARAAAWLKESGLATDPRGFVRVAATLQSVSHPGVFAAGDVAAVEGHDLEKSGVFAVREGRVLALNLQRALRGEPLRPYVPQRRFLSLISTGDRRAVASRGSVAFAGAWVWRWKDSIDRRFMRRYQELPEMKVRRPAVAEATVENPDAMDVRLTTSANAPAVAKPDPAEMRCGGCGAKVGATVLTRALERIRALRRDDVLVGLDAPDDGAVVEVPACKAMVHTVDFFRAMLDDPYLFGKIAANHALGDVYAMGGEPQTALAIVSIPYDSEAKVEETLTQLLAGACEVLHDAGTALVGGHTSEGAELGLGFAVNGLVDRARILRKGGLRVGDRLVLTKPIGTGTLFAADMRHRARGRWIAGAIASMTQTNRHAAAAFLRHNASACTDVTGFGLLGHLVEMIKASDVDVEVDLDAVPLLDGAEDAVRAGLVSSLHASNLHARHWIANGDEIASTPRFTLLFDPQTAGGLLAGVSADAADACVADLRKAGYSRAAVVGTVRAAQDGSRGITLVSRHEPKG